MFSINNSPSVIIDGDIQRDALVEAPADTGIIGNTNAAALAVEWRHPKDSRPVRWRTRAHSPTTRALVNRLLGEIEEHSRQRASGKGKRAYRLGPEARAGLLAVVEGFVGDLLVHAAQSRLSHHPVRTNAFDGFRWATGASTRSRAP